MVKQPFVREKKTEEFFIEKFVSGTDEKACIETIKRQWLEGDWDALAKINVNTLRPGGGRVKLTLLAAVGNLQIGKYEEAKKYFSLAKKWRASKETIKKTIIASIHNSLGRASIVAEDSNRADFHFSESVALEIFDSIDKKEKNASARSKNQINILNKKFSENNSFENNFIVNDLFSKLEVLIKKFMTKDIDLEINSEKVINKKDVFLKGKIALGAALYFKNTVLGNEIYISHILEFKKAFEKLDEFPLETWGIFHFLKAIKIFDELSILTKIFDESELEGFKKKLNWHEFVDESSYKIHNKPNNFYGVAYAIALLRFQLGWDSYVHCQRLLEKMVEHYRACSGRFGFADETEGKGRYDRYSFLLIAEIATHLAEGEEPLTAEMKEWLRRSCEFVLHNLNMNGDGFSYGRSIGAYGDSAYMEILTAAARHGLLSPEESQAAYAFCCKCTQKFSDFWWNDEWQSVDLWSSGRRTDAYRGMPRILGENFSLLYQHISSHQLWRKIGYSSPISDKEYQEWLDQRKKFTLTRFSENKFSYALLTVRDGAFQFNLPLVNGDSYCHETPYYPIPFSQRLIQGVPGEYFPQLTPQICFDDGTVLMPLAWFKNISMNENSKGCTLEWRNIFLNGIGKNSKLNNPKFSRTKYSFEEGFISRIDKINIPETEENIVIKMMFACFSRKPEVNENSVKFGEGHIFEFNAEGFDEIEAMPSDERYHSPEGPTFTVITMKKVIASTKIIECGFTIRYK